MQLVKFSNFFETHTMSPHFDTFLKQLNTIDQSEILNQWQGFSMDSRYILQMTIKIRLDDDGFAINCTTTGRSNPKFAISVRSRAEIRVFQQGNNLKIKAQQCTSNLLNGRYGYIPTEQEIETAVNTVTNDIYQLIEQKVASTSGN